MDITSTTAPDSTQINADDVAGHEITITVESVSEGTTEQPVNIHTVETPGRAYRPGKSMRRVLVAAWGPETSVYVGRRMTLYCDPAIRFGPSVTGGVRISHMSHIDKPLTVALTTTRGKRSPFTVEPLPDAQPVSNPDTLPPTADEISACTDPAILRNWWTANPDMRPQIEARKAELDAAYDGAQNLGGDAA